MRSWRAWLMCLCLSGLVPGAALGQPAQRPPAVGEREANILNETGLALRELYIRPAGAAAEGPDRLGNDTLPAGASLRVRLGRMRDCAFDVRGVFADGSVIERNRVDLCRASRVAFGDAGAPLRDAVVVNDTDLVLRELYAMPAGAADRGPDRLGSDTVQPGANFRLRLGRTRDCVFDLRAVFEDDSQAERLRVDICRQQRVGFGDASIPWREAVVENRAGQSIRQLYAVSRSPEQREASFWGPDRLGSNVLNEGENLPLRLRSRDCSVDLRAVYEDDAAEEKQGVDICRNRRVTFDGSGIPRAPERRFTLINRHGADIEQLYVSNSRDDDWGPDRLDDQTVPRHGRREVVLRGDCEVDLRVVFPNGSAEERRRVNICQIAVVPIRPGWTTADRLEDAVPVPGGGDPPAQGSIRLRNAAGVPMVELYTVAPDAVPGAPGGAQGARRGTDRLGATVLGLGETLDISPEDGKTCQVDLTAVFRDGREARRLGIDICAGTEVTLP
jgi:hypothetical protein